MKEFWLWGVSARQDQRSLILLFLRLVVSFTMLTHGLHKVANFHELSTTFLDPIGIGVLPSLILATFAEVVCSILIILGLFTRLASMVLVINLIVITFFTFTDAPFSTDELHLLYLAIYITVLIGGGGNYSLDWLLFTSKQNPSDNHCRNVSLFDRAMRMGVALFIWYLVLNNLVIGVFATLLVLISVPLMITSFWGYCYAYQLLGRKKNCDR